jgi:hypothetical protein
MRHQDTADETPQIAFYYPGPVWMSGERIKNLLLFFDGIGILIPKYMKDRADLLDPAITAGLRKHRLLHTLTPEKLMDREATEKLASLMTDIIASGALDHLARDRTNFRELSYSRLGSLADPGLAKMIFEELKARGLAKETRDSVSIPMHPLVRKLVLVLLARILQPYGARLKLELHPATDQPQVVSALTEMLSQPSLSSAGHVVSLDLQEVGVDVSAVPIDEIVGFRHNHLTEFREYSRSVRGFVRQLALVPSDEERRAALQERQAEIHDRASQLRKFSREAFGRSASLLFGIAGAAWRFVRGDPVGALLAGSAGLFGAVGAKGLEAGVYSYLFEAGRKFRPNTKTRR